jgi:hypothetical protein
MKFALHGLLAILLHFTPNAARAGLSIYHHHGIHIDQPIRRVTASRKS